MTTPSLLPLCSASLSTHDQFCRICYNPETPGNPLIAPCRCTGSLTHAHKTCILQWFDSFTEFAQQVPISVQCESCKWWIKASPRSLYIQEVLFYLIGMVFGALMLILTTLAIKRSGCHLAIHFLMVIGGLACVTCVYLIAKDHFKSKDRTVSCSPFKRNASPSADLSPQEIV
ncbi:hypothetical protein L596_012000 [Steinernema carpocapsae]|uniref:RING-CH-type domain-containing protein n=1 Tax=Steinernema carpocapsae TaxID=34508 RepID=A0A4U5NWE5_STECR|nr:hypothetical protein L596_012000 [Steinernema carpocapsae]